MLSVSWPSNTYTSTVSFNSVNSSLHQERSFSSTRLATSYPPIFLFLNLLQNLLHPSPLSSVPSLSYAWSLHITLSKLSSRLHKVIPCARSVKLLNFISLGLSIVSISRNSTTTLCFFGILGHLALLSDCTHSLSGSLSSYTRKPVVESLYFPDRVYVILNFLLLPLRLTPSLQCPPPLYLLNVLAPPIRSFFQTLNPFFLHFLFFILLRKIFSFWGTSIITTFLVARKVL